MIHKSATFSDDRRYRYTLSRIWKPGKPYTNFVGLNPSTADANFDDPTIRRCIRFAGDWGCGGMVMTNLFAFRATDPFEMKAAREPVGGADNDEWIARIARDAGIVVAAWGVHGTHLGRAQEVLQMVDAAWHVLGLTKKGFPKHPLYLPSITKPVLWSSLL